MSDLKINYHGHVCIGENTIYIRVWYYLWLQAFAGGGVLKHITWISGRLCIWKQWESLETRFLSLPFVVPESKEELREGRWKGVE
jgi:hypothetical protein